MSSFLSEGDSFGGVAARLALAGAADESAHITAETPPVGVEAHGDEDGARAHGGEGRCSSFDKEQQHDDEFRGSNNFDNNETNYADVRLDADDLETLDQEPLDGDGDDNDDARSTTGLYANNTAKGYYVARGAEGYSADFPAEPDLSFVSSRKGGHEPEERAAPGKRAREETLDDAEELHPAAADAWAADKSRSYSLASVDVPTQKVDEGAGVSLLAPPTQFSTPFSPPRHHHRLEQLQQERPMPYHTPLLRNRAPSESEHSRASSRLPDPVATLQQQESAEPVSAARSSFLETLSSSYRNDDGLDEVRTECANLRQINERLIAMNQESKQTIDRLIYEKEKRVAEVQREFAERTQRAQATEAERLLALQTQVTQLQQDLLVARASESQLSTIRSTLEKEKELDILAVKRQLMADKEQQLLHFQSEIESERRADAERAERDVAELCAEMEAERQRFAEQRVLLEKEVAVLAEDNKILKSKLDAEAVEYTSMIRANVDDFCQQFDGRHQAQSADDERDPARTLKTRVVQLESDLAYFREKIVRILDSFLAQKGFTNAHVDAVLESSRPEQNDSDADYPPAIRAGLIVELDEARTQITRLRDQLRRAEQSAEQRVTDATRRARDERERLKEEHYKKISRIEREMRARQDKLAERVGDDASFRASNASFATQQLEQEKPRPAINSFEDLKSEYPSEMQRFRESVEKAAGERHATHVRSLQDQIIALRDKSDAATKEHEAELVQLVAQIKERCTATYDNAMRRLKQDLKDQWEAKIAARIAGERERLLASAGVVAKGDFEALRAEHDVVVRDLEQMRRERESDGSAADKWEKRARENERQIASLQEEVDALNATMHRKLAANNEANQRAHQESIQRLKQQYIETLKVMKDDVAKSKTRSIERMEDEWRRRKAAIEGEWRDRLRRVEADHDAQMRAVRGRS